MPQAPAPALPALVRSFVDAAGPTLGYLRDRWQDEKEHENFSEYRAPLEKIAAKHPGVVIGKMSKRPFSVSFVVDGAAYTLAATARQITLSHPAPPKHPPHVCMDHPTPYSGQPGALGHGWTCGVCGSLLQVG